MVNWQENEKVRVLPITTLLSSYPASLRALCRPEQAPLTAMALLEAALA
jgi:hypothetical protein